MDAVRQFNEQTYAELGRVWPIDLYEIPRALLERCRQYRILKVPLMGQYFDNSLGGRQDWCGRTSSSMLYNYFALAQGGNPRSRYISHWDAGKYTFMDLRLPSGSRAFHKKPDSPPFDRKLDGVKVNSAITELWPHYRQGTLLPYAATTARLDEAAAIARSEPRIRERFAPVIAALDANNPLLIYTGFSRNRESPGHLILIVGYATIEQAGVEHLWLVMADPSTTTSKIIGAKKGGVQFFRTPGPATGFGDDVGALDSLSDEHNLIRVRHGDWFARQGALVLVRARTFFEQNTVNEATFDLLMDDFLNSGRKGGTFVYSTTPIEVPEDLVESSDRRTVCFPFDDPQAREGTRGPVAYLHDNEIGLGGFYPLGLFRNVHSGIHLQPAQSNASGGAAAVRAMAAGQIVAVRLPKGLPADIAEPADNAPHAARAEELSGTSNALVLVRHVLEPLPAPTEGSDDGGAQTGEEPLTFYSLYMHLMAPSWSSPADRWADVPWLNALLRRRGGSLTLVDPDRSDLGLNRWPVEAPGQPLLEQGSVPVVGERFTEHESLELGGPTQGGRTRAVAKPASEDVQQTLQALADGKVVTFAPECPDMAVERGELLGFVSPTSALGPGFLHWEVLAPEGGGLTSLVALAEERLGAAGLFGEFAETSDNNRFDPGGDELTDLVETLPDGAGDPAIANNYGPAELRALLRDAEDLPFALEAEPQPDHALVYPATVRLSQFRDAMPPGDYTVRLRFEGGGQTAEQEATVTLGREGPGEVTVMVPAWAEAVEVSGDAFHVQSGGPRATLEEHVEHLHRVAQARFRNIKLTHLNEWSPDGLETSLRARFEDAGDAIAPLVEAMAWWAHDEVPVVGPEGSEPPLFSHGGEPWQLPPEGKLEHLHPVVAAWVIELLGAHRHARLLEPRAPTGGEPTPAGWIGWLPAEASRAERVVGDSVQAIALSEASPADVSRGEVTLEVAVDGGPTMALGGGAWERDVVRAGATAWWWGPAQLSVEGASPQALGEPVLTVAAPVLDDSTPLLPPTAPNRRAPHQLAWSLPFSEHCPRELRGWLVFKAFVGPAGEAPPEDPAQYTEAHVGVPVHAVRRAPAVPGKGPVIEDGYVVRGPKRSTSYVTANFTWKEYVDAAGGGSPKVAWSLIEGVQAIRTANGGSIWLSELAADGLSIRVKGSSTARVLEHAESHAGFSRVDKVGEGPWIEIAVEAPAQSSKSSGLLDLSVDPTQGYAALLEELQPSPDQHVHVCLGLRFYNGGPLIDPALADVDACGVGSASAIDWDALRSAAGGGCLEVFASEPSAVLSRPAFGEPTFSLSGRSLVVSVPLIGGDKTMWKASAPKIAVAGKKVGTVLTRTGAGPDEPRLHLSASLDMAHRSYRATALTMHATVTKPGVSYGGAQVAIADSAPIEYDTRARVESVTLTPSPPQQPERLDVEAQVYGVPTYNSLELYFTGGDLDEDAEDAVPVTYARPDRWKNNRITGLCDEHGVFRASVSLDALHAALLPTDAPVAFEAHVARRWGKALDQTVQAASAPSQLAPPPAEDGTDNEQGPVNGGMNVPDEDD